MSRVLLRLGQISAFYTFANAVEAVSPFILAVVVTRILLPAEYGAWVLFISLVTFFRPILSLSLQDALRMRFYSMREAEKADFVWSSFVLLTLCAFTIVMLAVASREMLSAFLKLPPDWMPAVGVMAYFFAIFYFLLAYNQFDRRLGHFLSLHAIQTLFSISFIIFLVLAGWGWTGIVIGKTVALALVCVVGAAWVLRELPMESARRKSPAFRPLIKFGLAYLPAGMSLVAIPLIDRLIVAHVLGLAENGIYGIASLFGVAVFVAINGILHAWMPWLFRRLSDLKENIREVRLASTAFFLVLPLGGLLAYVVSVAIAPIAIGERFDSAFPLIAWAIAGTVCMGFFFHWQAFLLFKEAIREISISSGICILSNVMFSYFGAIYFGLEGVFAGTILAFLLSTMISATFSWSRYRVDLVTGEV